MWDCVCQNSLTLAFLVHLQAGSMALLRAPNPGSTTSPGTEFYTHQALLFGISFSRSRPNNTAKPHSCPSSHPLPAQGSLIHWSWRCCRAAKALWEFPRQPPTLATVSWGFRAAGLSIEMAVTYCLHCGNTRSSEGFVCYQVLTTLGEGAVQLISLPCTKSQLSSSHQCRWEISLDQVCFSC